MAKNIIKQLSLLSRDERQFWAPILITLGVAIIFLALSFIFALVLGNRLNTTATTAPLLTLVIGLICFGLGIRMARNLFPESSPQNTNLSGKEVVMSDDPKGKETTGNKPMLKICGLDVDVPDNKDLSGFLNILFISQIIYSVLGLFIGSLLSVGGIILFFRGISGSTDLIVKFPGMESTISNAAPGAIIAILGVIIVWITRFDIKLKTRK